MALIPGSYARAAGLQSEISKVTITRVAGSEVQFRRAIDCYQKDLRYHVNQIGREQRQLKKSMRRYNKKLRQGQRERRKREAKEKEASARLRLNARNFREAEQEVRRRNVLLVNHPDHPSAAASGEEAEDAGGAAAGTAGSPEPAVGAEQDPGGFSSTFPESPDSGIGTEADERSSATSTVGSLKDGALPAVAEGEGSGGIKRKVFLTSHKTKLPYLKSSKGGGGEHKDRTQSGQEPQHQGEEPSLDEDGSVLAQPSADDILLPVISEEAEDKEKECAHPSGASQVQTPRTERIPKANPTTSLNTKTVSASVDAHATGSISNAAMNEGINGSQSLDTTLPTTKSVASRNRTVGVSFGDLMKLQHTHTSGTKRLFNLVDRLASKHGIVDIPPPPSKSSSLDPRTNTKIKQRGDKLASQMSGDMVRQAAVLYPMKYGYRDNDDDVFSSDVESPVFILSNVAEENAAENQRDNQKLWNSSDKARKTQVSVLVTSITPGLTNEMKTSIDTTSRKFSIASSHYSDAVTQKLSVTSSGRRDSIDVTSPYYTFSDAACPVFESITSDSAATPLPDLSERRGSRPRQHLSMAQLSEHATRARDRSLRGSSPPGSASQRPAEASISEEESQPRSRLAHQSETSRASQRLSPLPQGSVSTSRSRRVSVNDQLHQRLVVTENKGKMAWQSAFGRLKMLHTLFDLTPHFEKDG